MGHGGSTGMLNWPRISKVKQATHPAAGVIAAMQVRSGASSKSGWLGRTRRNCP